jgi:hypothetical protein
MVPDSYTQQYAAFDPLPPRSRRRRPAEEQGQCHSFNADAVLGRTSDVYDINGIVSVLCRCVVVWHYPRQSSFNIPLGVMNAMLLWFSPWFWVGLQGVSTPLLVGLSPMCVGLATVTGWGQGRGGWSVSTV